jgi:SGNH hydrolase-like domain, acetyltransferase AlgX
MWSRALRRISQAILLLFFWLVLPLVLVEIAMIVLEPYLFTGFYQYDPDIGFRVRPYYGGTNRFGFNDKDYPLQRDPGTFRVLVLGDSFGWAGGKDGNYTALLEEKLSAAAASGRRVEVINAGYPQTHTGEQLLMLEKYGLQYEPDLVVLGFFAGNDFVDADPNRKRIIVNDIYIDIDKRKEFTLFGYPIVPKSRFLLFVQQKYKVFRERLRNQTPAHANEDATLQGTFSEDTFLAVEGDRIHFCNLEYFRQGRYAPNINFIFESLRKMRDLLQARGIPLIVAILPDEFQVEDELAARTFSRFNLDPRNYDLALMQKVLRGFLNLEHIPYVDMLERFKEAGKRESLYLLRDTHWNDAGNRLAATILQERLLRVVETYFEFGATIVR